MIVVRQLSRGIVKADAGRVVWAPGADNLGTMCLLARVRASLLM